MTEIIFGTESDAGLYGGNESISMLDSTHFVVVDANGDYVIGTISGDNITYGSSVAVASAANDNHLSALDSTHFVAVYRDHTTDVVKGRSKIGTITSGNVITFGSEYIFQENMTMNPRVTKIDSTHFAVAYAYCATIFNPSAGKVRIGTVSSGNVISYGTEYTFTSAWFYYMDIKLLNSTHLAFAYKTTSNYGTSKIAVFSGSTISSFGSENVFNSVDTDYISLAILDSTHFIVAYKDDGGDDYGIARIGEVSGSTISSYGAENIFNHTYTRFICIDNLDEDRFVISYKDDGGDDYLMSKVGERDGTTITYYGSEYVFSTTGFSVGCIDVYDESTFIVGYGGYVKIGTVSSSFVPQIIIS